MEIKRSKTVEAKVVGVRLIGSQVAVAAFEEAEGEERKVERFLTLKEARKLRKQLGQAIKAAEGAPNPF
ncbi:hypothetical protein ACFWHR_07445 [Leucobacter sp. NPDC058333]|uniref:hypothetical protein n=1 Tax=Leucobacter sp. NPDC058333 TaxID=3346450 RepID=UPI003654977D